MGDDDDCVGLSFCLVLHETILPLEWLNRLQLLRFRGLYNDLWPFDLFSSCFLDDSMAMMLAKIVETKCQPSSLGYLGFGATTIGADFCCKRERDGHAHTTCAFGSTGRATHRERFGLAQENSKMARNIHLAIKSRRTSKKMLVSRMRNSNTGP